MKIHEIIFEAISGPLYNNARDMVIRKIREWAEYEIKTEIDQRQDSGMDIEARRQELLAQFEKENNYKIWDQAQELFHTRYDVISNLIGNAGHTKNELYQQVVSSFKFTVEGALRITARQHIVDQFGEINDENLSWIKYIIVELDTQGVYPKSGRPKTGGGYFQRYPSRDEFADVYSQHVVPWGPVVGKHAQAIKLYTSIDKIWYAASESLYHHYAREFFGESEGDAELEKWLSELLPLFVHELVHLEQRTRGELRGKKTHTMGISYTPQTKVRPKIGSNYSSGSMRWVRGGLRGHPTHLGDDIESISMPEWLEYFGTDHEIEAYSAGAAAEIVHGLTVNSRNSYDAKEQLNRGIDDAVRSLAAGYWPSEAHSIQTYHDEIKEKASKLLRLRKWKDERALNKINIGWRKVWKIFMTKVVKHLQSYKTPEKYPIYRDKEGFERDRDPRLKFPIPKTPPRLPTDDASNYHAAAAFGPLEYK